jgi:predicted O-linked N-acetylglucosamine transferase (SPINDLY family)
LIGGSAHPEHLRIFREIDVGLDPYPHGGGITTCEALYMGVPVATLAGATPPSRNGSRILSAMGMSEWIATSEEEYVGIAVRAASDLRSLATLRKGLRQRMVRSPLGDLDRYRRTVESVYRTIWRRWCAREG